MENETVHTKKIGSIAFVLCMLATFVACAADPRIFLTLQDINGDALEQAAAGVPFIVEVVIQGLEGAVDSLTIQGAEKFASARQGVTQSIQTINGVTTSKMIHRFAMRIDSSGTYQLGPVIVTHSGKEYRSQPVRVQVGKKKAFKQQPTAQITMSIDKDLIVPGEATTFRIRFYADETVSLSRMTTPEFGALHAEKLEGPTSGYDTSDGKDRYYLEWQTKIYADQPGSYRIPAVTAEYRIPRKNGSLMDDDFFGGLFSRGTNVQQETSNSLEVTVNSLPPTKKNIAGVGVFSELSLAVDQDTVPMGDGVVLRLELIGTQNLERIEPPALTLPDGLKYYDSKQYIVEHTTRDGQTKKVFEYIVQGTREGVFTIPGQSCTFFNLYTRMYTTLTSNAVQLNIVPPPAAQGVSAPVDHTHDVMHHNAPHARGESVADAQQLLDGPLYAQQDRQMPWWLFVLMACIPLISMCGYAVTRRLMEYVHTHEGQWAYLFAFNTARGAIERACKQGQYGQLDIIFKQLFINRCGSAYGTHDAMIAIVQEKGVDQLQIDAFRTFLHGLAAVTFGQDRVRDGAALRSESKQWLDWLRKLL